MNGPSKLLFYSLITLATAAIIGLGFYDIMGGSKPRAIGASEWFIYVLLGAQFLLGLIGLVAGSLKLGRYDKTNLRSK